MPKDKLDEMPHTIKRYCGGERESSWIQLKCDCGQQSRKVYAYEDYQRTILNNIENDHKYKGNLL